MTLPDMRHLGGHLGITHTDEGSLKWLQRRGCKSLLDVGCSVGGQLALALSLGFDAYGFDGDYSLTASKDIQALERISFNDLTKTAMVYPRKFDAVWCCEVAEHIEEAYTGNLLDTIAGNLRKGGLAVFTANEGPGVHHVNRKPPEWWVDRLKEHNLEHDPELTKELVEASTMKREFIRNTGRIFRRL